MTLRRQLLAELYGPAADGVAERLDALVAGNRRESRGSRWSERDAWLICYPDHFGPTGLRGVARVATALAPTINGVHVLPFHPSSSDGGFSVEDYAAVDPDVGTWADVNSLSAASRLMADAVINHVSAQGRWFRAHLAGEPTMAERFRTVARGTDLSAVVRPRPGPPITPFTRADGTPADYWTTFSADQVDLDYRSPETLLAVCEAVLRLVAAGASVIRLDAVAFVWKDPERSSVHLWQTHAIVALLRDCLEEVDPGIVLVTETNVPHDDNVAYLGTPDRPEANAVYQFSLAPLVLHALYTGDTAALVGWLASAAPRPGTTVLNFLASHDGVGVRPARGLLTDGQIAGLAARCAEAGGFVNEAAVPNGTEPYELAATWRSLCAVGLGGPFDDERLAARIVATHGVALSLAGIPLLYTHSLVGSANDTARAAESGVARDLNRGRFPSPDDYLDRLDDDPVGRRVWHRLRTMLDWRRGSPAFHPEAEQTLIPAPAGVVAVRRRAAGESALVLTNLSGSTRTVSVGPGWTEFDAAAPRGPDVVLAPYEVMWLRSA